MNKKLSKSVSALLLVAMLPTLSSCKDVAGSTGAVTGETETFIEQQASYVGDDNDDVHLYESGEYDTIVVSNEEYSIPTFEDYLIGLKFKNKTDINIEKVLECPYDYPDETCILAGYLNIINFGYTFDQIKDELHNIMVLAQVPRCCTEEEYYNAVGKLDLTLRFDLNPFTSYYPLAKAHHLFECREDHMDNEFGICTCSDLQKEYKEKCDYITIREYLDINIDDSVYEDLKVYVDSHPGVTMDMIVDELNNVVVYALMPGMGIDEDEWIKLFGHLQDAMTYQNSLFERYTPLAAKIHNLFNPDDLIELSDGNTMLVRKKNGL